MFRCVFRFGKMITVPVISICSEKESSFKTQAKALKMRLKLICRKIFFIQLFSRTTFNGCSIGNNNLMLLKLSKMLLMNLTEQENLTGVSLLIDTDFA